MEPTREPLRKRLGLEGKPGLMARLSHLIIVQVVFVFAAVFLIIFAPHNDVAHDISTRSQQAAFATVARITGERLSAGNAPADLDGTLRAETEILRAVLYRHDASGLTPIYTFQQSEAAASERAWDVTGVPEVSLPHGVPSSGAAWPVFPLSMANDYVVLAAPVAFADGAHGMLAVAWRHNLVLSNRTVLTYALVLLFLCSGLVALLTVYLIHRRFTEPFRRVLNRLEKASDGELYYLLEQSGEGELSQLEEVSSKLAQNLYRGNRQLAAYDEKLRDTNTSLEESQLLLSTVIDNSPVGVITTAPSGRILLFNRKAAEIFGCNDSDTIGLPIGDLFVSDIDDRALRHEGEADEHGLEVVGRRPDGSQFAANLVTSTLRNDQGACIGFVFIVSDMSQSDDFREMMIRLDRYYTRGEMAGEIAHEVNNYLSILMGNVELVPLILRKGDMDRLTQKLELMHGTVEKIARLTDGLLDSSRGEPRFDRCDANQLVQIVVAFLKPQNKFDNTDVVMDLSPDVPLVDMDPGLMQQTLVNLIYNAGEAVFDRPDNRQIRVSTALVSANGVPTFEVKVHDNGPGVLPAKLPLMFKKRFTTKAHGHGIGLLACRKIIAAHRGDIAYAFDDGALFTVTIPVQHPASPAVTPEPAGPSEQPAPANF